MGCEQPRHRLKPQSCASGWVGREGKQQMDRVRVEAAMLRSALKPKVTQESARKRKCEGEERTGGGR